MTQIETARINELLALQIGAIQEVAHMLDVDSDFGELEANVYTLEKRIADLKVSLEAIPHDNP